MLTIAIVDDKDFDLEECDRVLQSYAESQQQHEQQQEQREQHRIDRKGQARPGKRAGAGLQQDACRQKY